MQRQTDQQLFPNMGTFLVPSLHAALLAPMGIPAAEEQGRGSGWRKEGKMLPVGLLGSSYQLFLGASFPLVLQVALTCAAGMSLLLGAVSWPWCNKGLSPCLSGEGWLRSHHAPAILGSCHPVPCCTAKAL